MLESWIGEIQVGAVEVTEVPVEYLKSSDPNSLDTNFRQSFKSILRGAIHSEIPVGLRIERIKGRTRLYFLTWSRKQENLKRNLTTLTTSVSAYLPKFNLTSGMEFNGPRANPDVVGVVACLWGEPATPDETGNTAARIDPMDAAGEILQGLDNVILQVFVEPMKSGKGRLRSLERAYENAMERSQKVVSTPRQFAHASQQSTPRVDSGASREAERLSRQVKRMSSRYLGKVSVTVTQWHQDQKVAMVRAKQVMSVLMSGITPADKEEDLRVKIKKKRKDFENALAGRPVGDHTILTPEEAAIYFSLPKVDLGIKVSRREDFSTATVDLPETKKVEETTPQAVAKQKLNPSTGMQLQREQWNSRNSNPE